MMDLTPVVAEVLKLGFAGAVIIVLFFALKSRDASFREVQEKRINESQSNAERFLKALMDSTDTNKANVKAIEALETLLKAIVQAVADLKKSVEDGAMRGGRSR